MIREYAPSLSNRGHFLNEVEVSKMKGGKDKFMSLFCYDESIKEYAAEKGGQSTSGFMMKGWSAFTKPKSKKKKYNGI